MIDPIVEQLLDEPSPTELMDIANTARVPYMTLRSWLTHRRTPRIDLLRKVASALGFDIVLIPKEHKTMPRPKQQRMSVNGINTEIRLLNQNKRIEAFLRSKLVGYVVDEILFGIDARGYAEEIGPINHRVEIIGKLQDWRGKNKAA